MSTVSPVCQYIAPADLNFSQQVNSMNAIMIISGREEKVYRAAQTVYDGTDLCVESTSGSANCLICRFFPTVRAFVYLDTSRVYAEVSLSASSDRA